MSIMKTGLLLAALLGATACDTQKTDTSGGDAGCPGEVKIKDGNNTPTGFVNCDGVINRSEPVGTDPTIPGENCRGDEDQKLCEVATDCTASPRARCLHEERSFSDYSSCTCAYSCASDDECGVGLACVPAAASDDLDYARCVTATCKSSSDCPSGECGLSEWESPCDETEMDVLLSCRADGDACRLDTDCASGEQCVSVAEVWQCLSEECR